MKFQLNSDQYGLAQRKLKLWMIQVNQPPIEWC